MSYRTVLNHHHQFSKVFYNIMSVSTSGCGPTSRGGSLPIHHAANWGKDISVFRTVFEAGMQHFPTKIGFLFHKDEHGRTSYQVACKKYGNEQVDKILDGVALNTTAAAAATATAIREQHDIVVKTLVFAATEERVHLDGVYMMLRRDPSVLHYCVFKKKTRHTIKSDDDNRKSQKRKFKGNKIGLPVWAAMGRWYPTHFQK